MTAKKKPLTAADLGHMHRTGGPRASPLPSRHPEHDKLRDKANERDTVSEFYDFLMGQKGLVLAAYHHHAPSCYVIEPCDGSTFRRGRGRPNTGPCVPRRVCGLGQEWPVPVNLNPVDLIGEFLRIDPKKLEAEKRAMLEELRS